MENAFCIILSRFRLYQGIALYRSLSFNYSQFTIFILCMDDEIYDICATLNMINVVLIRLSEIENENKALLGVKQGRKINEYCWTVKPYLIRHVINKYNNVYQVAYVDADMCFFSNPSDIFDKQPMSSVLLSEHAFLEENSFVERSCGKYNSGLILFRRNKNSWDALDWWRQSCLDWCYDKAEAGKFGDQKYLDELPYLFGGVEPISTPGVNIAPWNEARYQISIKEEKFYINNDKLICYHFCGLRVLRNNEFMLLLGDQSINYLLYIPYVKVIKQAIKSIEVSFPQFDGYSMEERPFKNVSKFKIDD